ncbi:O-antigen ligase [Cellulomonas sp. URHD0024]|uniref:O-antigen ligase family protein n=1 Tax=Cellulomonas sp. URHD0024 TaxID=1302620 RepID=UPI00041E19F9|nr:O-antigen ligase family protein [Cellulomonas sp. URHD0024]
MSAATFGDAGVTRPITGTSTSAARSLLDHWIEPGYVIAVAVGYLTPHVVDSFQGVKAFRPITEGVAASSHLQSLSATAGNVLILAASLLVIWLFRRNWRDVLGPAGLLLVAWLVAILGSWAHSQQLFRVVLLFPFVVCALTMMRPGRRAVGALGWVTVTLAALSILMGLFDPDAGRYLRPQELSDEKPLTSLGILAGVYPTGNNLGVALSIGLPAVALIRRRWIAAAGVALTGVALLWTASRTAVLAASLSIIVGLLMRLTERWRDAFSALVLAGAGSIAVLLPFVTRSPTAFTNRGTYWIDGLHTWRDAPWLGAGPRYYWDVAATTGDLGGFAYHAHNQTVQLLVTGGIVMFALCAAVVVWAIVRAVRCANHDIAPTMMLVALLVTATFEVPLGFVDREMYHPFALVALLLVLAMGRPNAAAAAARATADAGHAPTGARG